MTKKYELLIGDCLRAGDRTVYRIRALRDFGDVRCGDLGGYVENESALAHDGDAWVQDVAQVYGPNGRVGGNARVKGEAWVLGRVEGDAEICDLVVVEERAYVGGRTVLCGNEIVRGDPLRAVERRRAGGESLCVHLGRSFTIRL
jgi:hypothetical protein